MAKVGLRALGLSRTELFLHKTGGLTGIGGTDRGACEHRSQVHSHLLRTLHGCIISSQSLYREVCPDHPSSLTTHGIFLFLT